MITEAKKLYGVTDYEEQTVSAHEGGRNRVIVLSKEGEKRYVLRISSLKDRSEEDYLAETEFIRYLAEGGASVADVIGSQNGRLVEKLGESYLSMFAYAPGMLISDNGYRYREGAPLTEYFYHTGKTLGRIHALSKAYRPVHRRKSYFERYNMDYIDRLIPDDYGELKAAIADRLERFEDLPVDQESFGLVHFDFSDGNYHIDMKNGKITVFDFDNAINCWYMFDLANLWTHGVGWFWRERDPEKRKEGMKGYFDTVLAGYRSETALSKEMEDRLALFIDMVLIENIVDEFECCAREGGEPDPEDIRDAAECLVKSIPYAGFFEK